MCDAHLRAIINYQIFWLLSASSACSHFEARMIIIIIKSYGFYQVANNNLLQTNKNSSYSTKYETGVASDAR